MAIVDISLRDIGGTEAALGWVDGHTVVIDRHEGRNGGMGLGFTGAQMIALSIGGCTYNDLRIQSHKLGIPLDSLEIDVALTIEGEPLEVLGAEVKVRIGSSAPQADIDRLLEKAGKGAMLANSLRRGFPVNVSLAAG